MRRGLIPKKENHLFFILISQGLYRFLDPKSKIFFQTFSQNNDSFFPDSGLSNRWSIETLKNAGTKLFSWCFADIWVQGETE